MAVTYRVIVPIAVFMAAFFALSGPGVHIGTSGALLAAGALATTALLPFIAGMSRRRSAALAGAHRLALSDAEGLMRMDSDKG